MGHDISARNKTKETIAYLRYVMLDPHSYEIYDLLEVTDSHGGVSGLGDIVTFTEKQISKAIEKLNETPSLYTKFGDFKTFPENDVKLFLNNCLETARKEETVQIMFA